MITRKPITVIRLSFLLVILAAPAAFANQTAKLELATSDLIFSHQFHVQKQEVECTACHVSIEESALANDKNYPTMDECGACHDDIDWANGGHPGGVPFENDVLCVDALVDLHDVAVFVGGDDGVLDGPEVLAFAGSATVDGVDVVLVV